MRLRAVVFAVLIAMAAKASATTMHEADFICPVGGEKFKDMEIMSYTTFGSRPDGKRFGTLRFPVPMHECPGNKLVMFRDFTPAEIARLTPIVASPGYRATLDEPSYYRAAWLARQLGDKESDIASLLLSASWQVDNDPPRKERYQREFITAVATIPASTATLEAAVARTRVANAMRELGEFDKAAAALRALPAAPASPSKEDADQWQGLAAFQRRLQTVIERHDSSSEPLDMVPPDVAARRCMGMGEKATAEPLCATADIKQWIDRMRQWDKPAPSTGAANDAARAIDEAADALVKGTDEQK